MAEIRDQGCNSSQLVPEGLDCYSSHYRHVQVRETEVRLSFIDINQFMRPYGWAGERVAEVRMHAMVHLECRV